MEKKWKIKQYTEKEMRKTKQRQSEKISRPYPPMSMRVSSVATSPTLFLGPQQLVFPNYLPSESLPIAIPGLRYCKSCQSGGNNVHEGVELTQYEQ